MNFQSFKSAVAAQFERMSRHGLYRADIEPDAVWTAYLEAFPPGTNPIFRERTGHDCSCCKQFIRTVGNVVAVIDGKLESVWDVNLDELGYQAVALALGDLVRSKPIKDAFLHYERTAGTDKSFEEVTGQSPRRWNHFFVNIPQQYVLRKDDIPTKLNELRTNQQVFMRSLEEITTDAIETVLELIAQNSLYRGQEHTFAVTEFAKAKRKYEALDHAQQALTTWANDLPASVSRIRNTAIGTLLVDLSEGKELDDAVKAFEAKVAPSNYKRPTALATKAMIEKAKEKINELGLLSALDRRYATLRDISVNNVLWADRSARKVMGDVFDTLASETSAKVKVSDKIEEVPIDKFIADILPKVSSVEVLLENRHTGNLVSLIAPSDPTAGRLFKWGNNFSWSYNGELADSIKERVKQAGGNVTGDLCCRLAWDNTDDLDLHLRGPGGHIYYGDRTGIRGGRLDVDANGMNGIRDNPVENIFFTDQSHMSTGVYELWVNQFSRRTDTDEKGFDAEIDFLGQVTSFNWPRRMRTGENVLVAKFKYSRAKGIEIIESLPNAQASRVVWGLPTQTFHKVNAMLLSPNYWDDQGVGNKHYFFMLDGCRNDGTVRGFFNEFLDSRLDPHRKVFEMVGSKTKPADSDEQLSGVGISSTQRQTLTVRVKGSFTRVISITF